MMFTKEQVGFEHPAQGPHNCGGCVHFQIHGPNRCEIVSGTILTQDWCRKFSMKCNCVGQCFGACSTPLSPAEINEKQAKESRSCEKQAQGRANHPAAGIKEHDKIVSRTTGRSVEISLGPNGGNLVPKNPFASLAQAGYMHSHPEILGKAGLKEWDRASKGKALPKKVHAGN
jgi:hypothetical protein